MMSKLFVAVLLLMSLNVNAKTVLVLGDSISAGYGINVEEGWVALLQKKLQASKADYTIENASISGDTSAGGLARLDALLTAHKPTLVVLELGANDGLRGLSPVEMKKNLSTIIQRSQKTGAKMLLLGMKIPPNYGKRYIDLFYNVYLQLVQELRLDFVPFLLEDVALKPEMMQADGLHPNAKAQPLIADKIAASLFPLLTK
jgi:acyl-CoA thioesterase-1